MTITRIAVSLILFVFSAAAMLFLFGPVYDRIVHSVPLPIASVLIGFGAAVLLGSVELVRRNAGIPPDGVAKVFARGWLNGLVATALYAAILNSLLRSALVHRLPTYLAAIALLLPTG